MTFFTEWCQALVDAWRLDRHSPCAHVDHLRDPAKPLLRITRQCVKPRMYRSRYCAFHEYTRRLEATAAADQKEQQRKARQ